MAEINPKAQQSAAIAVAVVGASGVIGAELVDILCDPERQFPYASLHLLASERSLGKSISAGGRSYRVQDVATFDFKQVDLVFFCAGSAVSKQYVMPAIEAGCWVIDQSSLFRTQPHIPLIIPQINGDALASPRYAQARLIANPNCSTIQLLMAIYPIVKQVGMRRLDVVTYQAVSGAGAAAQEELISQTVALLNLREAKQEVFEQQIAFNCIPVIDEQLEDGSTREEMKVVTETEKIFESLLDTTACEINVTAVRVPVITGHAEAVHLVSEQAVSLAQAQSWLKQMPGVELVMGPEYPTQISHAANQDAVFVGRLRARSGVEPGLNMWVVADNLRKGGSLNAVQIAEQLLSLDRIQPRALLQ